MMTAVDEVRPLLQGGTKTAHTIEAMRALTIEAIGDGDHSSVVSERIAAMVPTVGGRLRAVFDFVARHVEYAPDPPGVEKLRGPDAMLADILGRGVTRGDCDESAVLLATLLGRLGIPPGFAVVARTPLGAYEHVLAGAILQGEFWPMDAQETREPGVWPLGVARRRVIPVYSP